MTVRTVMVPLMLAVSACSLTQLLLKPEAPIAALLPDADASGPQVASLHAGNLGWRAMFSGPRSHQLITPALEQNHDLHLAALNVEAVQAQFRIQPTARLPEVGFDAGSTRELREASTAGGTANSSPVQEKISNRLGLSAFKIDLSGRVRALSDAAFTRHLASEQGRRATQITLVGAVTDAYVAGRLAHEQRELTSAELPGLRYQAGLEGPLQLLDAQCQFYAADQTLLDLRRDEVGNAMALYKALGGGLTVDAGTLPSPLHIS